MYISVPPLLNRSKSCSNSLSRITAAKINYLRKRVGKTRGDEIRYSQIRMGIGKESVSNIIESKWLVKTGSLRKYQRLEQRKNRGRRKPRIKWGDYINKSW